jgi:hypothetical protein
VPRPASVTGSSRMDSHRDVPTLSAHLVLTLRAP